MAYEQCYICLGRGWLNQGTPYVFRCDTCKGIGTVWTGIQPQPSGSVPRDSHSTTKSGDKQ